MEVLFLLLRVSIAHRTYSSSSSDLLYTPNRVTRYLSEAETTANRGTGLVCHNLLQPCLVLSCQHRIRWHKAAAAGALSSV
jgi:hypothetical protein